MCGMAGGGGGGGGGRGGGRGRGEISRDRPPTTAERFFV